MQTAIKQCVMLAVLGFVGPVMALTCGKCRRDVLATDSFCQNCGADVVKSVSQSPYYQDDKNWYVERVCSRDPVYFSCGIFSPVVALSLPYPDGMIGHDTLQGVSLSALWSLYRNVYGLNVSGMGVWAEKSMSGLAISCFAISNGEVNGCQVGFVNVAKDVNGVQVGMLNGAKKLCGVQIGLLNVNERGPLKFFPMINVGW